MERYPLSVRTVNRHNLRGRVEKLFIDFNGLIHESVLRSAIVKQPTTELELFHQIAAYLQEIVQCAAPKYVFLAIDGPAPDAKIRQQRLRRIMGSLTSKHLQTIFGVKNYNYCF